MRNLCERHLSQPLGSRISDVVKFPSVQPPRLNQSPSVRQKLGLAWDAAFAFIASGYQHLWLGSVRDRFALDVAGVLGDVVVGIAS